MIKPKPKFRRCKINSCNKLFEVNPFKPFIPCCSIEHCYEYTKLLKSNKETKEWKDKKAVMKVTTHAREYKKALQDNVNLLSRMIDAKFGFNTCIDCDKPFGKQIDACHYHGRGGNSSLKYNLDNLHNGRSDCNQFSDVHKQGYAIGLANRYGSEYAAYVIDVLPLKYKEVHISSVEVVEKLKLVRSIIRHFNTYILNDSIQARKLFNTLIGIYL